MQEIFRICFSDEAFSDVVAGELSTPGVTPLAATARFFSGRLMECLAETMGKRLIKEPAITNGNWYGRYETLAVLAATGTKVWYPELRFSTGLAHAVDDVLVESTGVILEPLNYGFGVEKLFLLKTRRLKKQANHELRLLHVLFPALLFGRVADRLRAGSSLAQPYIANPEPHGSERRHTTDLPGYRTVAFDHVLDGTRLFCECARTAHDRMRSDASAVMNRYVPDSWPHRMVDLLTSPSYRDGLCHLCISDRSGPENAALQYGDNVQDFEHVYIDQLVREGQDNRTARAEVQRRLGLSRWKSEAELHQIVKTILPDAVIQRDRRVSTRFWVVYPRYLRSRVILEALMRDQRGIRRDSHPRASCQRMVGAAREKREK